MLLFLTHYTIFICYTYTYIYMRTYQDDSKKSPRSSHTNLGRRAFEMAPNNFRVISLQCCQNNKKWSLHTHAEWSVGTLPWTKVPNCLIFIFFRKEKAGRPGKPSAYKMQIDHQAILPSLLPVLGAYGVWPVARPQFWEQWAGTVPGWCHCDGIGARFELPISTCWCQSQPTPPTCLFCWLK